MTPPPESTTSASGALPAAQTSRVLEQLGRQRSGQDPAAVRQAASQLVSQLFFAPLLAEIRRLPFGRQIGHGGRAEEVFGEQLDLRMADAVASAAGGALTKRIERELGLEPGLTGKAGVRSASPPQNESQEGSKGPAAHSELAALPASWPVLLQVWQPRRTP